MGGWGGAVLDRVVHSEDNCILWYICDQQGLSETNNYPWFCLLKT